MVEGLLWFDSDPKRGLADKVLRAAARYRDKYGDWPNTCFVHPRALEGVPEVATEHVIRRLECEVRVLAASNILRHHFWLGVRRENDGATVSANA